MSGTKALRWILLWILIGVKTQMVEAAEEEIPIRRETERMLETALVPRVGNIARRRRPGGFQRRLLSHSVKGTTGESALTLPPLLISRVRSFLFSSWTLLTGGLRDKKTTSTSSMSSPWRLQSIQRQLRVLSKPLAHWPSCRRQSRDSLPGATPDPHRPCSAGVAVLHWLVSVEGTGGDGLPNAETKFVGPGQGACGESAGICNYD